ncbi:hypothetical protein [Granulicella mallensis]|uniref:Glycosyltransferase RgtA/B/C/D-like domain-containing protein n=1 Tax=Granulicella mallensis TaxID=940614 RepID=A0A7W8EBA3_9BACT|nr:hypothetical protein [Granulicella mallensis]MBB5065374.1 hypothetical protein [Granulicella mallensis]
MSEPSIRPVNFRAPRVIFWAGFALRMACILIGRTYRIHLTGDHFDYGFEAGRIARSLVQGHGYANPFNGFSGPTAWLPPLFPLLMALGFKLFGVYTNGAALFIMACDSLFSAAVAPAIYEIAARCFDAYGLARRASEKAAPVALWSAWLWALYPAALQFAIHWLWEMSLTACLFTWAFVFALRLRHIGEQEASKPRRDLGLWAVFGLLWGLVTLSNSSLLLVLPAWILWMLWPSKIQARRTLYPRLTGAVLSCLIFAATLTPWIIRNERTLHAFIPTRGNFGVELFRSVEPGNGSLPWGTAMPLWPGDPEFQRFVRMGEVAYGHAKGEEAKALIRAYPGEFLRRIRDRMIFFWDGTPHSPEGHPLLEYLRLLSYSFLGTCGLLGLLLALKRRAPGAWPMALAFLLVPLPYYFVTMQARFRHPLEPLIAVLAVYLFRSTQPRTELQRKAAR